MRGFSVGLFGAAVVAAHAFTTLGARSFLGSGAVEVFPGLVLRVFENAGGPFGLGPLWLAILGSIVALALLARRSGRSDRPQTSWPLALLAGGGIANLGERLFFGHTTNLLVIGAATALNLPDLAILAGLLFLLTRRPRPVR